MGWKKVIVAIVSAILSGCLLDGINNIIGAWLFGLAIGMASYYDGKQDGRREALGGESENPIK